jgi:hypothetical protein
MATGGSVSTGGGVGLDGGVDSSTDAGFGDDASLIEGGADASVDAGGASSGGSGGGGGNTGGSGGDGGSTGGSGGAAGSGGTGGGSGGAGGTGGTGGVSMDAGEPDASIDGGTPDDGGSSFDAGDGAMPNTAPGFVNLAPPLGVPLDPNGGTVLSNPPAPTGWTWYPFAGTQCRDGSPAGIFVHFTTSDKLYIYLEGGGACTNAGFCNFNPANVNRAISGTGEIVIGSIFGVVDARQQPGVFEGGQVHGIFDTANAQNPFRDWNGVYVPYCTGDVHFGTREDATVPGVTAPQQFVGYRNMQEFIGRIVPTFENQVDHVVITGASAGAFGAALNFSMVQDAFGDVLVDVLLDSGIPFSDSYMPPCMQQRWRAAWGLDDALPPDCTECFQANGGGLLDFADFLIAKHPNSRIALVSSMEDQVIRLFFSMGLQSCANYDTADPYAITLLQGFPDVYFPAASYTAGLNEVRTRFAGTGRLATYYLAGSNVEFHQHIWRTRFTDPTAGSERISTFVSGFLAGQMDVVGP